VRQVRRLVWLLWTFSCCVIIGATVGASASVPLLPANPMPADHGTLNPIEQSKLTWGVIGPESIISAGTARYDVLLGKTGQMMLVAQNLLQPSFEPGELEPETEYQWQVIVHTGNEPPVVGPVWTFTCIQWIWVEIESQNLWLRCIKPGRYAAMASVIKVASNDCVGLTFGPGIGDLIAGGDAVPTWYTFGESLDQALAVRGWIRAADLPDQSFPDVFPKCETGTRIELWVMFETDQCNSLGPFSADLEITLTKCM